MGRPEKDTTRVEGFPDVYLTMGLWRALGNLERNSGATSQDLADFKHALHAHMPETTLKDKAPMTRALGELYKQYSFPAANLSHAIVSKGDGRAMDDQLGLKPYEVRAYLGLRKLVEVTGKPLDKITKEWSDLFKDDPVRHPVQEREPLKYLGYKGTDEQRDVLQAVAERAGVSEEQLAILKKLRQPLEQAVTNKQRLGNERKIWAGSVDDVAAAHGMKDEPYEPTLLTWVQDQRSKLQGMGLYVCDIEIGRHLNWLAEKTGTPFETLAKEWNDICQQEYLPKNDLEKENPSGADAPHQDSSLLPPLERPESPGPALDSEAEATPPPPAAEKISQAAPSMDHRYNLMASAVEAISLARQVDTLALNRRTEQPTKSESNLQKLLERRRAFMETSANAEEKNSTPKRARGRGR